MSNRTLLKPDPSELKKFFKALKSARLSAKPVLLTKPTDEHQSLRNRGKRPSGKSWKVVKNPAAAMEEGHNIGVWLGEGTMVVDVDPRNFGKSVFYDEDGVELTPFDKFVLSEGIDPDAAICVQTGGGGFHFYFRCPKGGNSKPIGDYPGIDLLFGSSSGHRQTVAPGSVHAEKNEHYVMLYDPELGVDIVDFGSPKKLEIEKGSAGVCKPDNLAIVLKGLDPSDYDDREVWLVLMMACHHATNGNGREEFKDWSIEAPGYYDAGDDIDKAWASISSDRDGGITYRFLQKKLSEAGRGDLAELVTRVDAADDFPDDITAEDLPEKSHLTVLENWVWVADATSFIRRADLKQYKPEQWNSLFASLDPEYNLVSRVWKGKTLVKKYESLVYIPGQPEVLKESQYNIWRPSGVEAVQGDTSIMEEHLELLLPDETERNHLLDFMHFVCCKPEVKIMFALLLQGAQGTGKTAISELLRRVIGADNVSEPSNDEVNNKWTKWQEGASLAVIEELLMGDRMAMSNRLKPVITNSRLRIEDKGKSLYTIPNHLNIMAFTNHKNAVRLEGGDRRWLVLFSPMLPQAPDYYGRLFNWIKHPDSAAAWKYLLRQRQPKLNPTDHAPITEAKLQMREMSLTNIESTVNEWKESRTGPLKNDLFRFDEAFDGLGGAMRPHKASLKLALENYGCVKHERQKNSALPNVTLWSVVDHKEWEKKGPAERTKAWMAMNNYEDKKDFEEMN